MLMFSRVLLPVLDLSYRIPFLLPVFAAAEGVTLSPT